MPAGATLGSMGGRSRTAQWALGALAAALVLLGSTAFACTNLATINLSTSIGRPGDAITVTGTGFMANADEMPMDGMVMEDMGKGGTETMGTTSGLAARSPVVLRWDGPDGPVLADAIPDRSGTISVLFTVPEAESGSYTVLAVQKNPQGYDVYGTPARAPLQVVGVGQPPGDALRGSGSEGAAGESSSPTMLVLIVGLGVLGMGLVAAGVLSTARVAGSRREVPARIGGDPGSPST